VAAPGRPPPPLQGLAQGADLVDLDQDRVADSELDAAAEALGIGDEEIVADQLQALAELFGEQLPAVPVLLVHAVLDREDRVARAGILPVARHLLGRERAALVLEHVGAVLEDLAGRRVEGDEDVHAGLISSGLHPGEDGLQRRLIRLEVGREATLVAHRRRVAAGGKALLQGVEDLGADAQAFREAVRAGGDDHELLEVDRVVGVGAAVEDVHHRHRQKVRLGGSIEPGQVAEERLAGEHRRGLGGGQRYAEDRVGAEAPLVRGAVELDHLRVERGLVRCVGALQRRGDLAVDVGDSGGDALAGPGIAPVAQLDRLELTGRGTRGDRGEAASAGLEGDFGLDGRIAPRVEDLAGVDR
jgi:hypothetical protein